MDAITCTGLRTRRRPTHARIARALAAPAVAAFAWATAACGADSAPTQPPPAAAVIRSVVGTWKGEARPSYAATPSVITIRVDADATMLLHVDHLPLCESTGVWTETDGQFTATSTDCVGVVTRFVAPIANSYLLGTWSSNIGYVGTFSVTRQ